MKSINHRNAFQPVRPGLALGLFLFTTIAFSSSTTGRASNKTPQDAISQTGAQGQAGRSSSSDAFTMSRCAAEKGGSHVVSVSVAKKWPGRAGSASGSNTSPSFGSTANGS